MNLYQILNTQVTQWRESNYPHDEYDAIGKLLEWSTNPDGDGWRLRKPQIYALETYWYLRLVAQTPKVPQLYEQLFSDDPTAMLDAFGIPKTTYQPLMDFMPDIAVDKILEKVVEDDDYAKEHKLDALRETLTLDYPSYIFALTMGAGKTALMGAIIATEFAMAIEYPDGEFVQNALIFAPGKAIIESLRELLLLDYTRILPPYMVKSFSASLKLTFTRDGEKDIPVQAGSIFNVVVTNTAKIRIRSNQINKGLLGKLNASADKQEEARENIANLRLQKIASLPNLGIFSDEAHRTYGNSLDKELKKVRLTVDYLAEQTRLICVVNMTGTPYFKKQLLKDVVVWYGLSQGIEDGILKEVSGNIFAYDLDNNTRVFVENVIKDFFARYGSVTLPSGAMAKIALYFPQTDQLEEMRPIIENTLAKMGYPATIVLAHHSKAGEDALKAFNRLNDPTSLHRVIMLVNIGTEGWNCPSLFATALARKLKGSNNFVLQSASRCLRQVVGNREKASIYLSRENYKLLDNQLRETYGETIRQFSAAETKRGRETIRLRKVEIPPLVVKRIVQKVVRKETSTTDFTLNLPKIKSSEPVQMSRFKLAEQIATGRVLTEIGDTITIEHEHDRFGVYSVAVELATIYRVDLWAVLDGLRELYNDDYVPSNHIDLLAEQIERQTNKYDLIEEVVEHALALVKPEGFTVGEDENGNTVYTAEITYPIGKEELLVRWEDLQQRNERDIGFHYTPYNFDSRPEKDFFDRLLDKLQVDFDDVEDIYFTGALHDPAKTDFVVQYRDENGRWRNYTPDFVVRCKDGKLLIVEVKRGDYQKLIQTDLDNYALGKPPVSTEGAKAIALKRWETLNPDKLKYQLAYSDIEKNDGSIDYAAIKKATDFLKECGQDGEV